MPSKILASDIISLETFIRDPRGALSGTAQGTLAVFEQNIPAFYALSAERLAYLLSLEAQLTKPPSDVMLEAPFFEENTPHLPAPVGKFAMYQGWQPDADFLRMAALWGVSLAQPVTPEELSSFVTYWQAEGKFFHHIQWQQKLARSVQMGRQANGGSPVNDVNAIEQSEFKLPKGFRG